ncbi:MAG: VWA domain-containing protein [Deltaproteobacteria bacterium]|nr:VWA domain-containing protein [Deltaproteobacteria bacterium]MBW2543231.1 VWA domain-containing protein [Deltaproteobacteria bacterium]
MSIRISLLAIGSVLLGLSASADDLSGIADSAVRIVIDEPKRGEPVSNSVHQAPIRGNAFTEGKRRLTIDVMIAIDISGSTRAASGVDVDGDGEIGFDPHLEQVPPGLYPPDVRSTDPHDTILAAEIAAADALLRNLDPTHLRVGVLSFGGEVNPATLRQAVYGQQDAWLEVPLTSDFDQVRRALQGILARGPRGGTNFAAGIRLAVTELAGLHGARSAPRPEAAKILMFLTDGVPSFPFGSSRESDPGDTEAALGAARVAHKAGITINAYSLGTHALDNPVAATEMSRLTLGTFTPVVNPGDVITYLQGVTFASVEDVIFTNLTTSEISEDVRLLPNGSFSGYVPVREGTNRVRVTALASDGSEGFTEFDLQFDVAGRTSKELTLELDAIRKQNRELQLLVEREKVRQFRERQRKGLKLEVEELETP